MYNLLIFGTSECSDVFIDNYLDLTKSNILAYVNGTTNYDKEKRGYKVISPKEIKYYSYDYLVIASTFYDEIKIQCLEAGVLEEKIIGAWSRESVEFKNIIAQTNSKIDRTFNTIHLKNFCKRMLPPLDVSTFLYSNELYLDDNIDIRSNTDVIDTYRVLALFSAAREININNVPGNVAELGVYKGDFARIINKVFPDKTLYLFDTFEGFNATDLKFEALNNYANTSKYFEDTSIDLVLSKMPRKDKCRIIKGYFPDSAKDIDDVFSFVSIDADLFLPIYSGLNYFYKRLSKNGYIFVHDFNNSYFSGAREAVMKFCSENEIGYMPITDSGGSVIIVK